MAADPSGQVLVLGVGDAQRRDLGVGLVVVEALRHEALGAQVTVETAGSGLEAVMALEGHRRAVVVCAAQMGAAPGTVRSFWAEDAEAELISVLLGTGGMSLGDWLELGALTGEAPRVRVVGVEPGEIAPGSGLSLPVGQAVAAALEEVRQQIV